MVKILFLAANPTDTTPLKIDQEMRAIDQALLKSGSRNKFLLEQHWAVQVSDLQSLLLRHQPDIVHFSGHGSISSEIILQNELDESHPVSAQSLKQLFSILRGNIKCVVLSACFSQTQAEAIAEKIDCVIGMTNAIDDKSAIEFSSAFYQALGFGKDTQTAFDLGCLQIDLRNLGEKDSPKLVAPVADPKKIVFQGQMQQTVEETSVHPTPVKQDNVLKNGENITKITYLPELVLKNISRFHSYILLFAGIILGILIGYTTVQYNLLGSELEREYKEWMNLGLTHDEIVARLFDTKYPRPTDEPGSSYLFASANNSECEHLLQLSGEDLRVELRISSIIEWRPIPQIIQDNSVIEQLVEQVLCSDATSP